MGRFDFWLFHLANGFVAGTGIWYGWMRYVTEPVTQFAIVNHPWQSDLQHAHILTAPLLVGVAGHFWYRHAWLSWKSNIQEGRNSGTSMMWLLVPMILSGYCIQVSVSEQMRLVWIWTHCLVSGTWLLAYAGHVWVHLRTRRLGQRIDGCISDEDQNNYR